MPKPLKHSRQVMIIHDPIIRGALKKQARVIFQPQEQTPFAAG